MRYYLLLIVILSFSGCGFQPRGDISLPSSINPVYISGISEYKPMYREIRRALDISNIQTTKDSTAAQSELRVFQDKIVQSILSVDARGKILEYDIIYLFSFALKDKQGKILVQKQTVSQRQSFLNPETTVLGKTQEQQVIEESLRKDISNNMLFRIKAALK